jgi:hypothetical protein
MTSESEGRLKKPLQNAIRLYVSVSPSVPIEDSIASIHCITWLEVFQVFFMTIFCSSPILQWGKECQVAHAVKHTQIRQKVCSCALPARRSAMTSACMILSM